jgi:copper transport protein
MIKRIVRLFVGMVVVLFALPAGSATAHAVLIDTEPSVGAVLDSSPEEIILRFNESVSTAFSSVRVIDQNGEELWVVKTRHVDGDRTAVRADAGGLGNGTYIVVWRVTSADGHPVQGSFTFQVGTTSADVSSVIAEFVEEEHGLSRLFSVIRWVLLAGVVVLIGGVWLVTREPDRAMSPRTGVVLWGAWTFAIVATLQTLMAYGPHATGLKIYEAVDFSLLGETLTTGFGQWQVVRLGVLGLVAVLLREIAWRDDRRWRMAMTLLLAGLVVTISGSGHPGVQGLASVAIDMVHLAAVGLWVGALAVIAVDRHHWLINATVVNRFSTMAGFAVPAIVATGVLQTLVIVGNPLTLVDYRYGRLLLVKVSLVVVIVALGGVSRRILRRFGAERLGASMVTEVFVGAAIIAITAVLTGVPPTQASTIEPFVGSQVRNNVILEVTISPARVGATEIHVVFVPPGGSLQRIELTDVRLGLPERGVPNGSIVLQQVGPNHWSGNHTFAFAGEWDLSIVAAPDDNTTVLYDFDVPIED